MRASSTPPRQGARGRVPLPANAGWLRTSVIGALNLFRTEPQGPWVNLT